MSKPRVSTSTRSKTRADTRLYYEARIRLTLNSVASKIEKAREMREEVISSGGTVDPTARYLLQYYPFSIPFTLFLRFTYLCKQNIVNVLLLVFQFTFDFWDFPVFALWFSICLVWPIFKDLNLNQIVES